MTTNRYLTRAQQRRLIAASVFYILLLYTRFTPRRNTRGWRPEKKGRDAACAQAAPRVCLPSRPAGPEPEGTSGQQHVDHGLQPQQIAILIGAAGLQPGQIHFVKCRSRIVLFEEHYHIDGSIDDFACHSLIGIVEYNGLGQVVLTAIQEIGQGAERHVVLARLDIAGQHLAA